MTESAVLETQRLFLRRVKMTDVQAFHDIYKEKAVMRYWSTDPHKSMDETHACVLSMYEAAQNPASCSDEFVICMKGAGEPPQVVGKLGVWKIANTEQRGEIGKQGEIGFILNHAYWGKGIATEALTCFLQYFWKGHEYVKELVADVDPRNVAAVGLLMKHGFVQTGYEKNTFQLEDGWCDSVYLKLDQKSGL